MSLQGKDEFTLPSGATLLVCVSAWENIKALHDAVLSDIRGTGVGGLDLVAIKNAYEGGSEAGFNQLADKIIGLLSSKPVEQAVFVCAEKALYRPSGTEASSVKVTRSLFDDPKVRDAVREDYYHICAHVAEVNLRPFIKALFSSLKARAEKSAATLKSSAGSETQSSQPSGSPLAGTAGETPSGS